MLEVEARLRIPIGLGSVTEQCANTGSRRELVECAPVQNKVISVNPEIYSPLNLVEGESSPLGIFASQPIPLYSREKSDLSLLLVEAWHRHTRSALLGRMLFADKEGRVYRDVDLKGAGEIDVPEFGNLQTFVNAPGAKKGIQGFGGLMNKKAALVDYENSEDFLRVGIRTHRVIGIIKLEEILFRGQKLSFDDVMRMRHGAEYVFEPVIQVRAFGTKARVSDLKLGVGLVHIADAKKMVAQELGRETPLTDAQYLEWFAKTLGKNVGIMHSNEWVHPYLTDHNITLDCRIVDLDSVETRSDEESRSRDVLFATTTLDYIVKSSHTDSRLHPTKYTAMFYQSYDRTLAMQIES